MFLVYLCLRVKSETSWMSEPLHRQFQKRITCVCGKQRNTHTMKTDFYILYWNRSYPGFNWNDCGNSSLVLFTLFRLDTRNFSPCFPSCPAFCPLQIITAASNNTSPTCCVPAGRGRGSCKREKKKNSLCHQEFYWAQIDFTTLRWTAVSSWFRQLSMYQRSRKANASY